MEEEDRIQRKAEKAPEAPKVPAAVMDAIQMSDAWEQFWRRYKSQLVDWKHWSEEMEDYHKQAAGWYFTQGFIQSQVANTVPAAPDEDPENMATEEELTMEIDPTAPPPPSSQVTAKPKIIGQEEEEKDEEPPPAPSHKPEDEADDEDFEGDAFQKKIRRKKKMTKMDRYEALLKDPIFDPNKTKPKMQPWGQMDGEIRAQPGQNQGTGIEMAPEGATFMPKSSAMDAVEKAKLDRMKRMLAVVRGPKAMANATYGTNYLPTQDDALQFIKLERFRRDRHRFRSSDHDSETASSDDDAEKEAGTSKERGAKLPAWMRVGKTELEIHGEPATNTNTRPTTKFTNVNQPGEMVNPAGEALPISSSSESEEDEERAAKMRAMAARFNPSAIYDTPAEKTDKEKDTKKVEGDDASFSFGFLDGENKNKDTTLAQKPKLYNREGKTPKYVPEEGGPEGPGIHKDGPLKGLPKFWQQQSGLRQRPKEANKPQFVEISEEYIAPSQKDLPEFVQDLPDQSAIVETASMAIRDYQKSILYGQKKTKYEEYIENRRKDSKFSVQAPKEEIAAIKQRQQNVEVVEESLEFDPNSFFGKGATHGMFTSSAETVPKENEKPKKSKYVGSFGGSWKKKPETAQIAISLSEDSSKKLEEAKAAVVASLEPEKEELPDFLKEPVFDDKAGDEGFGWQKDENKGKRKGTKDRKRKTAEDGSEITDKKSKKDKKQLKQPAWMKRVGEDPDKPLMESAAGMEIDESELRTYNDGNPVKESTTEAQTAGDRDDRDWGAWKPRSGRSKVVERVEDTQVRVYAEGEKSELHKKLLDPARFDYDPDFARAGSLQFMHPLQCSKVLGRPYPEDLSSKGQVAFSDDIVAYRAPKPIQDPAELGPEPPPDGAIFWGIPEEVETAPRLVILKCGVPENCPGPEPRGWLDGLKRRKWYQKANQQEIRPIHPAHYFKKGEQLHQDKTFGVFYHPKYYGKTKEHKAKEIEAKEIDMVAEARESLKASFAV